MILLTCDVEVHETAISDKKTSKAPLKKRELFRKDNKLSALFYVNSLNLSTKAPKPKIIGTSDLLKPSESL